MKSYTRGRWKILSIYCVSQVLTPNLSIFLKMSLKCSFGNFTSLKGLEASQLDSPRLPGTQEIIDNPGGRNPSPIFPWMVILIWPHNLLPLSLLWNSHICLTHAIHGGSEQTHHGTETLPSRVRNVSNANRGHFPVLGSVSGHCHSHQQRAQLCLSHLSRAMLCSAPRGVKAYTEHPLPGSH